jgi:hypothetical protein
VSDGEHKKEKKGSPGWWAGFNHLIHRIFGAATPQVLSISITQKQE